MAAEAGDKVYVRQYCSNTNVFSLSLKVASNCEVTKSAGRLFHRGGALVLKAWSLTVAKVRHTISL